MTEPQQSRGGGEAAPEGASLPNRMSPFAALHREIDRLFDDFTGGRRRLRWGAQALGPEVDLPAVDVAESDEAFEISVEMPGVDPKKIEVSASDGMLSIKGEKTSERAEKKKRYYLSERQYGAFERSFALPRGVDVDKISADHSAGVLKITLPKTQEAKARQRKIEIKAK